MKSTTSAEFVRALDEYQRFVSTFFRVELLVATAVCDSVPMAGQLSVYCGSPELHQYLDRHVSPLVVEQSFPVTHAVNTVAVAARHVAHLASRFMEDSRLSALAWHDMLVAAVLSTDAPQLRHLGLARRLNWPRVWHRTCRSCVSSRVALSGVAVFQSIQRRWVSLPNWGISSAPTKVLPAIWCARSS